MSSRPFLDEPAIAAACRSYGVRRLELFGSAVRDPEHANDFDFLVDLEETEPGVYAKTFFGLYDALRNQGTALQHCCGNYLSASGCKGWHLWRDVQPD